MSRRKSSKFRLPYGHGQLLLGPRGFKVRYYRTEVVNGAARRVRRQESLLGVFDEHEAIQILQERLEADSRDAPIARPEEVTFSEAARLIQQDYVLRGLRSWSDTERRIRKHLAPTLGHLRMIQITSSHVDDFVEARLDDGASGGSVNRETAILRRMFNLLVRARQLEPRHVPAIRKVKEAEPRQGFLEEADLERIVARLPDYLRGPVTFAYRTGWRIKSEVLPLRWAWVDLQSGRIAIPPGITKNGDGRVAFLDDEAGAMVHAAWAEHVSLFPQCPFVFQRAGQPIKSLRNAWDKARVEAGLPTALLHDMRRSAARNFDRNGVPQRVAREILGHKTSSMWDRYRIVPETDLQEAARRMSQRSKTATNLRTEGQMGTPMGTTERIGEDEQPTKH